MHLFSKDTSNGIKSDSKDIYHVKTFIMFPEHQICLLMISEESCDIEDRRNDC